METKNNKELCAYIQPETEVLMIKTENNFVETTIEPGHGGDDF
jgi:hypothetical protein